MLIDKLFGSFDMLSTGNPFFNFPKTGPSSLDNFSCMTSSTFTLDLFYHIQGKPFSFDDLPGTVGSYGFQVRLCHDIILKGCVDAGFINFKAPNVGWIGLYLVTFLALFIGLMVSNGAHQALTPCPAQNLRDTGAHSRQERFPATGVTGSFLFGDDPQVCSHAG